MVMVIPRMIDITQTVVFTKNPLHCGFNCSNDLK